MRSALQRWRKQPDTWAYVSVILAAAGLFSPNLLTGGILFPLDILYHQGPFSSAIPEALKSIKNPHLSDLITIYLPWLELFRDSKTIPLWNPYSFCGSPLLANAQNGFLFPLTWLHWLLPLEAASVTVAIGKLIFAGVFAFLFFRKAHFDFSSSLLGALSLMFSGHLMAWLGYPTSFPLVTMPFLLWALERYLSSRQFTDISLLAVAFGLLFLGGQPQTGFLIALITPVYFFIRLIANRTSILKACLGFLMAAGLGLCLAAPQVLPFAEYLRESAAAQLRGSYGWKEYPWFTGISWLIPRFFGDLRLDNFWGFSSFLGEAVFIGGVPLLLAMVGISLGKRTDYFWASTTILFLGVAGLYVAGLQRLYARFPLLSNIDNNKIVVWLTLGLVSFAVIGSSEVVRPQRTRRAVFVTWSIWLIVWAGIACVVTFYFKPAISSLHLDRFLVREFMIHISILMVGTIVLWLWRLEKIGSSLTLAAFSVLTIIDVFRIWVGYYPSFPAAEMRPKSSSLEFLQTNLGDQRFLGLDGILPPETSTLYRLNDARGYDGLTPYRYYKLLELLDLSVHDLVVRRELETARTDIWSQSTLFHRSLERFLDDPHSLKALRRIDYWSHDIHQIARPAILSLLGVRYVLTPAGNPLPANAGFIRVHSSDAEVWESPNSLPRAFVCPQPFFADSEEAMWERISAPDFDPAKNAVMLFPGADALRQSVQLKDSKIVPARVLRSSLHEVELLVETPTDGWLILLDLYYPGWLASVDGKPARIFRANYLFRGVKLGAGKHVVRFSYQPKSFLIGVALCLGALGLMSGIAIFMLFWRPA